MGTGDRPEVGTCVHHHRQGCIAVTRAPLAHVATRPPATSRQGPLRPLREVRSSGKNTDTGRRRLSVCICKPHRLSRQRPPYPPCPAGILQASITLTLSRRSRSPRFQRTSVFGRDSRHHCHPREALSVSFDPVHARVRSAAYAFRLLRIWGDVQGAIASLSMLR